MTEDELKDFLKIMLSPFAPYQKVAESFAGGVRISTIYAGDIHQYETAIEDRSGVHPVERYETKEEALVGHEKWTKAAPELLTVIKLGYGTSVADKEIVLRRESVPPGAN